MSIPFNQDIYAYVVPGGEITLQVIFETWRESRVEQSVSDVQLTITPAAGGSPVVTTSQVSSDPGAGLAQPIVRPTVIRSGA